MNVGVCYLGRRIDRLHVSWPGLARYPFHGLCGAIAWRFDGRTLMLMRLGSLKHPYRERKR